MREGSKSLNVIFVCSVSSPSYKLVGNEKYPEIESDYEKSFAWFNNAEVDVFLGSHAGFFGLEEKAKNLRNNSGRNPFIDPAGYKAFVENNEKAFREKLRIQKSAPK